LAEQLAGSVDRLHRPYSSPAYVAEAVEVTEAICSFSYRLKVSTASE
jgi:hypothetical protein